MNVAEKAMMVKFGTVIPEVVDKMIEAIAMAEDKQKSEVVEEATFRIYGSGIKAKYSQLLDKTTLTATYKLSEFLEKVHLLNKIKKAWRNKLLHKNVA